MSPFIARDLYILNEGMQKIGYYKNEYIAAGLSYDGLLVYKGEGAIILPAEIYFSADRKMTLLIIRSGVYGGKERPFSKELIEFVKKNGFTNINIHTSTLSPVSRERDTNRLIPEVFTYVNNHQLKQQSWYYVENGIQLFKNG